MLYEVKNGSFARQLTLIGFRYQFIVGTKPISKRWGSGRHRQLLAGQQELPVALVAVDRRTYWTFEGRFWWDDEELDAQDVLALIRQRERRKRRQLDSARASLALDEEGGPRREPIPRELRRTVWERDGGACVECGDGFELQYDHIIPVSRGGATTLENLQILCADCNRAKSDMIA